MNNDFYDGFFEKDGQRVDYRISDNNTSIGLNNKMSRYIHFFVDGDQIDFMQIYGDADDLTNISGCDALKWYEKMIDAKKRR